jgi:acetate kinase
MPAGTVLAKGLVERIGDSGSALIFEHQGQPGRSEQPIADHERGMAVIIEALVHPQTGVIPNIEEIGACGHRVVHGMDAFTGSVLLDDDVIAAIGRCSDLAPLHNPPNLTGIRAAQHCLPDIPQVACFDTAFHATIPKVAYTYGLPVSVYEDYGIRRYGFHGTSHRFVARRAAEMLGMHKYDIDCITCHLGNGCSVAAIQRGLSVDTSMGLTPLEGLVMGTRCGDIDPAILFYLGDKGHDLASLNKLCNKESGLLGVSGKSNDMRTLLELTEQGDERAELAIDIFCYRVKKYFGSYLAVLGRADAIVFTGGIGNNAPGVRQRICQGMANLGIVLDEAKNNDTIGVEADLTAEAGSIRILSVPTNEELAIARDTFEIGGGLEVTDSGT